MISVPFQFSDRHAAFFDPGHISCNRAHLPSVGKRHFRIVGRVVIVDEYSVVSVFLRMKGYADLIVCAVNGMGCDHAVTDNAVDSAVIGFIPTGEGKCIVPHHLLHGEVQHIDCAFAESILRKHRITVGIPRENFRTDAFQQEFLLVLHGKRGSVRKRHGVAPHCTFRGRSCP